jgi:hypothetical protein
MYGKLFTLSDFQQAGVPDEYILASLRCLHPAAVLVDNNTWPIRSQCQYTDLMRFRIDTWLNETCAMLFTTYLQTLNRNYYFLDPATFNNNITKVASLMKMIDDKGYDQHPTNDIIILFHIQNHFIIVEVCRSTNKDKVVVDINDNDNKNQNTVDTRSLDDEAKAEGHPSKIPISLACSLGHQLDYLIKQVEERHLDLFLNTLIGSDAYEYKLADHVQKQTNYSDCGVICLQRMYKYAVLDNVSAELPENLKSPMIFRCFALYKILEFYKKDVSPFVMYNEEMIMAQEVSDLERVDNRNMDSISQNLLDAINKEIDNPSKEVSPSSINPDASLSYPSDVPNLSTEIVSNSTTPVISIESTDTPSLEPQKNVPSIVPPFIVPIVSLESQRNSPSLETQQSSQLMDKISDASSHVLADNVTNKETTGDSSQLSPMTTDIYTPVLGEKTKEEIQNISASIPSTKSFKQKRAFDSISTTTILDDTTVVTGISNDSTVITSNRSDVAKAKTQEQEDIEDGLEDEMEDDFNDTDDESTIAEEDNFSKKKKVTFSDEETNSEPTKKLNKKKSSKLLKIKIKLNKKKNIQKQKDQQSNESNDNDSKKKATNPKIAKRQKTIESPTRSSIRLQQQVQSRPKDVIIRVGNQIKRRPRDPKNHAIGFTRKAPKTMSVAHKKYRRMLHEKLEKIEEMTEFYDTLHEVDDDLDSSDEENIINFYKPSEEWHFVDKSNLIPNDLSKEDRHKFYAQYMYDEHEQDQKIAQETVDKLLDPQIKKAKTVFSKVKKNLESLYITYGNVKNKLIDEAKLAYEKAYVDLELLEQEKNAQRILLPHDSIIAIQILPSRFHTGQYDYFVMTPHPIRKGGFCKKMVSKEWLYKVLDPEFTSKLDLFHESNGWISFGPEDPDSNENVRIKKIQYYENADTLEQHFKKYKIQPLYEYKPLRSDDQILVVRCKATFNPYAHASQFTVKKFEWSILTLKQYYTKNRLTRLKDLPENPLAVDNNGERIYNSVYTDVPKGILCGIIGCELVYLFEVAAVLHAKAENKRPYTLSYAPKFTFADDFERTNQKWPSDQTLKKCNSKVELEGPNKRFIDMKDFTKNNKHVMPMTDVGVFLVPQYYYFDMRQITTPYFISVQTQQISGLYYDESKDQFCGLVKHGNRLEHLDLEIDWVEENFHEEFLELVKKKSRRDRRKYIKLPIGKAKPLTSPDCNRMNPVIHFLQNGKDNCVFASMASALFYMTYNDLSSLVWKFSEEFEKTQYTNDTYGQVLTIANAKIYLLNDKSFNKNYQMRKIKYPENFDLIKVATLNPKILYHVVLKGSDGSENHCVAIYNNFIFDGNYTHAWKLAQKSLDECIDSTYTRIIEGYMHVPYK